jgi:LPXTG-site transpeptidase (sortase) family protein
MKKIESRRLKVYIVLGTVILLTISSLVYFFLRKEDEVVAEPFDPNSIVTESVDIPEESEAKEFYVPPDLPKSIKIPKIKKEGYIQLVAMDKEGRIAVPTNVHLAGWYINSVKPGEKGLSIIDGHRDGSTIGGIFRDLEKLKQGDTVTIEYGDSSKREFKVVDSKILSVEDAYDFMYSRIEGVDIQLNLVTCGGVFNREARTYDERVIVRAKGI